MSLTPLEEHIFAHYLAHGAGELNITQRAYPHGELLLVIQDKIQLGLLEVRLRNASATLDASREFVDLMIAREGFSTIDNGFGGSMHRLQLETYRALVAELADANAIVRQARAAGEGFWAEAFAGLAA